MKCFIPTYKRYDTITSHEIFKRLGFDVEIWTNSEDLARPYLERGIDVKFAELPRGISYMRQYIWDLVPEGEWF